MYKYAFLFGFVNRRKQPVPVENDRRETTHKQATARLSQSLDELEKAVNAALQRRGSEE